MTRFEKFKINSLCNATIVVGTFYIALARVAMYEEEANTVKAVLEVVRGMKV